VDKWKTSEGLSRKASAVDRRIAALKAELSR
jgi:hypothetical protein